MLYVASDLIYWGITADYWGWGNFPDSLQSNPRGLLSFQHHNRQANAFSDMRHNNIHCVSSLKLSDPGDCFANNLCFATLSIQISPWSLKCNLRIRAKECTSLYADEAAPNHISNCKELLKWKECYLTKIMHRHLLVPVVPLCLKHAAKQ